MPRHSCVWNSAGEACLAPTMPCQSIFQKTALPRMGISAHPGEFFLFYALLLRSWEEQGGLEQVPIDQ